MKEEVESPRSLLTRIARPKGWAGMAATITCILATLLIFNSVAYQYLEKQPVSAHGPEAKPGAFTTLPQWYGLIELDSPVDTIILGDSTAALDLVTGPIADRLGGTTINLGNNVGSSVLMDAWMLQYYLDKFGPPRNVILLRSDWGYEMWHSLEYMSVVPFGWGWWDRLGVAPVWIHGEQVTPEQVTLFVTKFCVLHSDSDILSYRLIHPLDLSAQPRSKVTAVTAAPYYFKGVPLSTVSILEDNRRAKVPWRYNPFAPTADSAKALTAMSEQARSRGFQLYIVTQPEWDEAYQDPDRQTKVSGMGTWLAKFTDSQYVHLILSTPMTFPANEMHSLEHLRPGAETRYTEAVLAEIVAIQNRMTVVQAGPIQMTSAILDKSTIIPGEKPALTLLLTANESADPTATVSGSVSGLVRASGKSDGEWTARGQATAFTVEYGKNTEVRMTFSEGEIDEAGVYDLVLFLRQNAGELSFETRVYLPSVIEVR